MSSVYKNLIEAVRYWLVESITKNHSLPTEDVYFVYPDGPCSLGWDTDRNMIGKRIRVTIEIENES